MENFISENESLKICADIANIAKHFDLYEGAFFQTDVTDLRWDEAATRWIVEPRYSAVDIRAQIAAGETAGHERSEPADGAGQEASTPPSEPDNAGRLTAGERTGVAWALAALILARPPIPAPWNPPLLPWPRFIPTASR